MTEEDAKKRWCPFAKLVLIDTQHVFVRSFNKKATSSSIDMDLINDKCIGSKCMAWRAEPPGRFNGEPVPKGYCGLAGKP